MDPDATSDSETRGAPMLRWAEIAVGASITCAAAWLHVARAGKAGGLWRDEAGAANLAQLPSIGEIAANLHHEAFPILFAFILRAYSFVTGGSDDALRVFGLVIGLSLLLLLWVIARFCGGGVPLVSLALLGINASMIQWTDWMRGHGLGTVLILSTLALVWRVATKPSRLVVGLAAAAAICSVHTLYYNAVLLFAIGVAGAAIALRRGSWKPAFAILAIGAVAAASLLPYVQTMQLAGDSSFIYTVGEFGPAQFWEKLREALGGSAPANEWIWVVLAAAAIAAAAALQSRRSGPTTARAHDTALYAGLILVLSVPAYFLFLRLLKYQTQPWYYIALMGVAAVAIDTALGVVARGTLARAARIVIAGAIAGWSLLPAWAAIQVRQTNVDLAATRLTEVVAAGDVVIVMPWYLGVPFGRYYTGAAPWLTVPPISDRKLQRYDLLKEQMMNADALEPVAVAMSEALRAGNRVWLVGQLMFPQLDQPPAILPPAPHPTDGWNEGTYQVSWILRTMYFLQTRVARADEVPIPTAQPLNPHENLRVMVVQGWRGSSTTAE